MPSVTFLLRVTPAHICLLIYSVAVETLADGHPSLTVNSYAAVVVLRCSSAAVARVAARSAVIRKQEFLIFSAAATSRARQSPSRRAFSIVMNVSAITITNTSRCGSGTGSMVTRQYHQNIPPALFCSLSFLFFPPLSLPGVPFFFLPQLLTEPMLLSKRGKGGKKGWGAGENGWGGGRKRESDKARKKRRGGSVDLLKTQT